METENSAIETVTEKAGGAASVVGSGAKKVASAVAENPLLTAAGAVAVGTAVGGATAIAKKRQKSGKTSAKKASAPKSSAKKSPAKKSPAKKSSAKKSSAEEELGEEEPSEEEPHEQGFLGQVRIRSVTRGEAQEHERGFDEIDHAQDARQPEEVDDLDIGDDFPRRVQRQRP